MLTIDQHRRLLITLRFLAHNPQMPCSNTAKKALDLDINKQNKLGVITLNGVSTIAVEANGIIENPKKMQSCLNSILKQTTTWRNKEASETKKFIRQCIDALN